MKRILLLLLIFLALSCRPASEKQVIIGVSTGVSASGTLSVADTYTESVRLADALPLVLPQVKDSIQAERYISMIDGLVMTGGEDIDPRFFGEEVLPECGSINPPRDTSDVLLLRAALRRGLPILAICRGEQVLNVVLGGTLYQDIPSQIPSSLAHSQKENRRVPTQTITMAEGTHLRSIIGRDTLSVNSFHHQAVKDLAPGLVLSATTSDGVVEAYESSRDSGLPFIMATQFHPEAFAKYSDPVFSAIFADFVAAASSR